MKNYEVRFILPNMPGEVMSWVVKARDEFAAVKEANFSFFDSRRNIDAFLVRETKEREHKTAQNWSRGSDRLIDSPVNGYKQIKRGYQA